ncbi:MAG: glycerol-3-phosphate acyltransferase [Chloroflexota bacterium]
MTILNLILASLIGYLIGAIPFGKIYVWYFRGIDIQEVGSGRTGGTNSLRAGGWTIGFMTSFSDVLKGMMVILIVRWLFGNWSSPDVLPWLEVAAGVLSVIGHNWSIYVKFGGGAGAGPNIGWASAVFPPMFPIAFMVMFGLIYFVGWASVASMTMALIIPIVFSILYLNSFFPDLVTISPAYIIGGLLTSVVIAYALRKNFVRLLRGEERVVGLRARNNNSPDTASGD